MITNAFKTLDKKFKVEIYLKTCVFNILKYQKTIKTSCITFL